MNEETNKSKILMPNALENAQFSPDDPQHGQLSLDWSIRQESILPIGPPSVIEAYDKYIPGGAARVLELVEKEQRHRHAMDEKHFEKEKVEDGRGYTIKVRAQVCAVIVLIAVLATIAFAIYRDQQQTGLYAFLGLFAVAVLVVVADKISQVFIVKTIQAQNKKDDISDE
jgi:uncharacterized membrane protein